MAGTDHDRADHAAKNPLYRNEEWLRRKYWEEEMSMPEIAENCGCHPDTVHKEGWPQWHIGTHTDYDGQFYPVHRLLAVTEFGIEAVAGNEVHHKNGIP